MSKIFVSYRRNDTSPWIQALLRRSLIARFGSSRIFWDTSNIPSGSDFRRIIEAELAESSVILAIIGLKWESEFNENADKREQGSNPHQIDFIEHEITTALGFGKKILPVLVDRRNLPDIARIPKTITDIFGINFARINENSIDEDIEALMRSLGVDEIQSPAKNRDSFRIRNLRTFGLAATCAIALCAAIIFTGQESDRALSERTRNSKMPYEPQMVLIPAGEFRMGSKDGDPRERPVHSVSVERGFYLAAYEVTTEQWNACAQDKNSNCKEIPLTPDGSNSKLPVVEISWQEANQYIHWLKRTTGRGYRLPTEAEWEYAARLGSNGGIESEYVTGKCLETTAGNVAGGTLNPGACTLGPESVGTTPVGSFRPNSLNIYDLAGNVWEWVQDCRHENYENAPSTAKPWDEKECAQRVIRGGAWKHPADFSRNAYRGFWNQKTGSNRLGFRLALSL